MIYHLKFSSIFVFPQIKPLMKKLLILIYFILSFLNSEAQIIYGENNYTQYQIGTLPIVISVPHGGLIEPANIPDRSCNNPTTITDSYTIELAMQMDSALFKLTGCHPHIIICNLKRTKIDCNREISEGACSNPIAEKAWHEFQNFIDTAQKLAQNSFAGKAFYIDLHGHGKPILRLELGYGIKPEELNNNDSFLNLQEQIESSSIQNLVNNNINNLSHAELLRGDFALGTLFSNAGFPSVPSKQYPDPDSSPYFYTGYNTNNHTCLKSGNTVNGLQLECHQSVRFGYLNRKAFADSFANILCEYLLIHQNLDLKNNCGKLSNGLNSGSATYLINIFPNPFNTFINLPVQNLKGDFEVLIYNSLGNLIFKSQNQSIISTIDFPKGIYYLSLKDQNNSYRQKLIKN